MKKKKTMGNVIEKGIAVVAKQVAKVEVNSTCPYIIYQPQLPESVMLEYK